MTELHAGIRAAACMFALLAAPAFAAPPPEGSDDAKIMGPYKEWVESQHDGAGRYCCDIGDGRPVEARLSSAASPVQSPSYIRYPDFKDGETHWEVHVTPEHFPGEPDRWLAVPEEKVTRNVNPTGVPILWLYKGVVQCFAPPDGT